MRRNLPPLQTLNTIFSTELPHTTPAPLTSFSRVTMSMSSSEQAIKTAFRKLHFSCLSYGTLGAGILLQHTILPLVTSQVVSLSLSLDSLLPPLSGSWLPAYLCGLDQSSSSQHKTKVEHKLKPTLFDDVISRGEFKITHRISQTYLR